MYEFDIDLFLRTFSMQSDQVLAALAILGKAGYMEYLDERENSARVMIRTTREELYNQLGQSHNGERLLVCILRLYPGLFTDYVFINEKRIARELDMDIEEVYQTLLELARLKIISYVPRRRSPYIYMPTAREEARYLQIGKTIYEDQIKRRELRIESMIDYADNDGNCRVERMLKYFGEPKSSACGSCDICRSEKESRNKKNSDAELYKRLMTLLTSHPHGVRYERVEETFGADKDRALTMVRHLCSEKLIYAEGPLLFLKR